jgi:flavin reductase (DIM6/NTAB) family NADH-FMN oxidoreductase RutF
MSVKINSEKFKKALSHFATGVTVVTSSTAQGLPVGLTANAFTSVSLDPPMILVCLDNKTGCIKAFSEGKRFAVNILRENQQALSDMFAGPQKYKFKNQTYDTWESDCPILSGCLVNLECLRVNVFEAGDHIILLGKVERIEHSDSGRPLLYYKSSYVRLENDRCF